MKNEALGIDYSDSHWGKYDCPIAQYIEVQILSNGDMGDDSFSNSDLGEGWIRFGRRIYSWTSQGFVYCDTLPTVAAAIADRDQWWAMAHSDWDEECDKCGTSIPFDYEDAWYDHEREGCGEETDDETAFRVKGWAGVAFRRIRRYPLKAQSVVVMVGDDTEHVVDDTDLTPLDDSEYCGGCGQIGCTAYGEAED